MIDVVIPCLESDIPILNKCVPSLRKNLKDGVGNVFIVGRETDLLKVTCKNLDCDFVNEVGFMGFDKYELGDIPFNRNGWLYQQLIKLSGDRLSCNEDFLVCDADHILLEPHSFIDGGVYNFYYTGEYHVPYFRVIDELFQKRYQKIVKFSFISDKMIFNKDILHQMKDEIEFLSKEEWVWSIVNHYDKETQSGFSEFETYGTFISNRFGNKVNLIDANRYMESEVTIDNFSIEEIHEKYKGFLSITQFKHGQ
jgi:hypothetical protein